MRRGRRDSEGAEAQRRRITKCRVAEIAEAQRRRGAEVQRNSGTVGAEGLRRRGAEGQRTQRRRGTEKQDCRKVSPLRLLLQALRRQRPQRQVMLLLRRMLCGL
jgi:hypothetical protein